MRLKDKVAVVTGAGSGLGRAAALALAEEGARVAVNDVNESGIEKVTGEIWAKGGEALGVRADVSDSGQVKEMFSKVLERFGAIDILVNNAGIAGSRDEVRERAELRLEQVAGTGKTDISLEAARTMSDDHWARTLHVHLFGTFYCTREALNTMEDKGYGKIINIASIAGMVGLPHAPDYCAAKAGIIGFTKSVARDVIAKGVYVNAIAPGYIDTPMLEIQTPGLRSATITQIPMGRLGKPEEVAAVAVFLASDESSYVVGQVISPAGGGFV